MVNDLLVSSTRRECVDHWTASCEKCARPFANKISQTCSDLDAIVILVLSHCLPCFNGFISMCTFWQYGQHPCRGESQFVSSGSLLFRDHKTGWREGLGGWIKGAVNASFDQSRILPCLKETVVKLLMKMTYIPLYWINNHNTSIHFLGRYRYSMCGGFAAPDISGVHRLSRPI